MRVSADWRYAPITVVVTLTVAVGAVLFPSVTAVVSLGFLFGVLWLTRVHDRSGFFLAVLGTILWGYAFFGKGFAYLGYPPLYVSELVLVLGVLTLVVNRRIRLGSPGYLQLILVALMAWGAIRTVEFIPKYGLDALRDAALWYYSVFALLVGWLLTRDQIPRLLRVYSSWLPFLLAWIPVSGILFFGVNIPNLPWADVPFVYFKAGDMAVHLAGAASFLILGLQKAPGISQRQKSWEWVLWVLWGIGFVLTGSINRGGLLGVILALGFASMLSSWQGWGKLLTVVGTMIAAGALVATLNIPFEWQARQVSPEQILTNIVSVVSNSSERWLDGTKEWRLAWWEDIVDYTVFGEYFWLGKGYGINLAVDDGYSVGPSEKSRSPHNGHLTLLARGGVPTLLLWVAFHSAYAWTLLSSAFKAWRNGKRWTSRLLVWIFTYWLAIMVNASFDVYLEGPQGGIWFWSVVGLGLAAITFARNSEQPDLLA